MFTPRSAWMFFAGLMLAAMPLHADFSVETHGMPGKTDPITLPAEKSTGTWSARLPVIIEGEAPPSPSSRISPEKAQPVSAATMPRSAQYPSPALQPTAFNAAATPYNSTPPYYGQMPPQYNNTGYGQPPQPAPYAAPAYGVQAPGYGYAPQPYPPQPYGYAAPPAFGASMSATPTYMTMYTKPAGYSVQGNYAQPYAPQPYPPTSSYYGGTSSYGYGAAPMPAPQMPMPQPMPGSQNYMGPPYGYGPPPGYYYGTPHSGMQSYSATQGSPTAMPFAGNAYPGYTAPAAPPPEPKKKKAYRTPAS
jgi:hypothetical protein